MLKTFPCKKDILIACKSTQVLSIQIHFKESGKIGKDPENTQKYGKYGKIRSELISRKFMRECKNTRADEINGKKIIEIKK